MLLSTTSLTKARVKTTSGGTRPDSAPQIFGTCLLFYSAARPGGESRRRHENPQGLTARVVGRVQMLHRWDKLVDGQGGSQKCDIPINLHTYLHSFTLLDRQALPMSHSDRISHNRLTLTTGGEPDRQRQLLPEGPFFAFRHPSLPYFQVQSEEHFVLVR
jgi:hypothetical protein